MSLKFTGNIEIFSLNNGKCKLSVIDNECLSENTNTDSNLQINDDMTKNENSKINLFQIINSI